MVASISEFVIVMSPWAVMVTVAVSDALETPPTMALMVDEVMSMAPVFDVIVMVERRSSPTLAITLESAILM